MGKETEQKQEIVNQGVHTYSQEEAYVWPEEPVLREQLEWFQDQKLALMVHWGVYNQLGMVASWALSDEDAEWSRKTVDWTDDGEVFKRQYRALNRATIPATMVANAAVGPAICTQLPPRAEITKPATMAVKIPASGPTPEASASAIDKGSAMIATMIPAVTSLINCDLS